MTFGSRKKFPIKTESTRKPALFGPFRKGDPAHIGHNKTFGGNGKSTEYNYVE